MKVVFQFAQKLFGRIFYKRSIIIISERKTNHIALSGVLQFGMAAMAVTCVVWASFSTGRYMATRSVLEERDETIKSVANSRIDTNFNFMVASQQPRTFGPVSQAYALPLTDPAYTLSAVTHDKLFARIAMLENKVKELRSTNAEIIQTVREKTQSKILSMEDIIRQTGLSVDSLKEQARRQRQNNESADTSKSGAQGGPFIPAETNDTRSGPLSKDLELRLDQLSLLNTIVESLPLSMPIPGADLQSNFGRRIDPFTGRLAFHAGVDLTGPHGTSIRVTAAGKVVSAGHNGAYGNAIDVDHGYGIVTRYGHLSKINVSEGEMVKKGQIIGVQGSTGRSTGPHLHYEVRQNDRPLNPINFLNVARNVSEINQ